MKYEDGAIRPDAINIQKLMDEHIQEFMDNGKLIGIAGLAVGSGGNLSMRVPGGMLVTSTGSALDDLRPNEIIFVAEANRDRVYFIGSKDPSSESINHWTIYKEMPEVKAIAHVNVGAKNDKNIPVTPEDIPYGTIELSYGMLTLFKTTNVIMLKNHGVVAIGQNLREATKLLVESADKDKPHILPLVRPLDQ